MSIEMASRLVSALWPTTVNTDVNHIQFLESFIVEKDPLNGLVFQGVYIPEEIMLTIFSILSPKDLLSCSLVCKNWHNITKSSVLWRMIYNKREFPQKAKDLPWYVFYCYFATDNFKNLLRNGNGEEEFKYWDILLNGGDKFDIEREPQGSDPLPEDVPEFHGHGSCFVTSFDNCVKHQVINLKPKRLLRYIIRKFKPTLYASEWFTGRFDCACMYKLTIVCHKTSQEVTQFAGRFSGRRRRNISAQTNKNFKSVEGKIEQWHNKPWKKLEIFYKDYPEDVESLSFCHEGRDLQFWAGHYGSKMAGGVIKFQFESIEPVSEDVCNLEEGDK